LQSGQELQATFQAVAITSIAFNISRLAGHATCLH
jgi:hypothetical protein